MAADTVEFRAEPIGLLRVPLLSRAAPAVTQTHTHTVDPQDRNDVRRYIDALNADGRLEEALAISSPSLHRAVETLRGDTPMRPTALRKLALSATRYVLRAASRPTPFGLLAGVAPVAFADTCRVRTGTRHRKAARPDHAWLLGVIAPWETDPTVLRGLRVVVNDLGFARGERWVLPGAHSTTDPVATDQQGAPGRQHARERPQDRAQDMSVRHSGPVRTILHAAQFPVLAQDLLNRLDQTYPQVPTSAKEHLLTGLVRQGFLLTELRPPLSEPDPLRHVIDTLKAADQPAKADRLATIRDLLDEYGAHRTGNGPGAWHTTVQAMNRLHAHEQTVHVDMRVDTDITLPREVLREAERAATALRIAAPQSTPPPELREYHRAFLERYGTGQAVPLRDVLDPHTGLGPPAGYDHPHSDRQASQPGEPGEHNRARDAVLSELALTAIATGAREVALDDATLDRLRAPETPPAPLELCARLTGASPQAVERGDFALVVSPRRGQPPRGPSSAGSPTCSTIRRRSGSWPTAQPTARPGTALSPYTWTSRP
ncbi:hypothetical protein SVIO_026150 [Streptomyces violaceusniger]|uniref:Lantibiotic dehydratase N-terminal domain-containing protein n=1 Tax=Streptomyces violaceusniger TaxID=68280 RepID=A0A4D4KTI2_STRVO|nr:hypothetical protein SVIO_026150 [Streptomyces violaceusniger]